MWDELSKLFLLAIPIAWASWTVTREEVFRELREFCAQRSETCRALVQRKFFYVWTCEFCFSHYMTILVLALTQYRLLYDDWRGYLVSGPALVSVANIYMSLYGRLRVDIRRERAEADLAEQAPREEGQLARRDGGKKP